MSVVLGGSRAYVGWVLRHGRLLWFIALLLAVPAALRTAWLYVHLNSDLEQLLPRDSPGVLALDELRDRVGAHQYLGVVVDAGSSENVPAAVRFLDDLAARVREYPPRLVSEVRTGEQPERKFLEDHGVLYLDVPDLRSVQQRIEARRDYEASKEQGALLDEDTPPPPLDFSDIQQQYEKRLGIKKTGRGAGGRYVDESRHLAVLVVELGEYSTGTVVARDLIDRVHVDIAALGGVGHYAPGMRVGLAGDAAITVEELSALVSDLSISSVVVVFGVIAAIVIYYRWWRSVLAVVPPLALATVYAFAVASLPPFHISELNSNTAFLGSIIVGNGINFGLVLLARYVEERRAGGEVRGSLERAVAGARAGTLAAAAAAAAAYGSLAITDFRGFRQFGWIGGLGMLFAWGMSFLLMPSLVAALDHGEETRPRPRPERTRVSYWVTWVVARAPRVVSGVMLAITVVAALEVAHFRATDIETDFSRLRRRDSAVSGADYWGDKMNQVLGEYLTPLVFLADDPEQARALAQRLKADTDLPSLAGRIDSVRTMDDVLPTQQEEKLAIADSIRDDLTPRVRDALPPEQRDYVDRLFALDPHPIGLADLPRDFLLGLRERNGTLGRIVLVYPNVSTAWWDGKTMHSFVDELRSIARESVPAGATPPRLAGSIVLSSDIADAIMRDGKIACAVAFAGVVAVILLLLGARRTALYVVGALLIGVVWLAGAAHLFGIRINFANFIAFPITFGIGVDYAVNVVSRYEQDGERDVLAAVRSTGAAVALCSLTTIIGYSSLLMAENRALSLFGLLAVLGEIACLTVALVGLPAVLLLLRARRAGRWTAPSAPVGPAHGQHRYG